MQAPEEEVLQAQCALIQLGRHSDMTGVLLSSLKCSCSVAKGMQCSFKRQWRMDVRS